jgi:hypothetical protein
VRGAEVPWKNTTEPETLVENFVAERLRCRVSGHVRGRLLPVRVPRGPTSEPAGSSARRVTSDVSVVPQVPAPVTEDERASTQRLMEAARALLDQHHSFTEAELCQYVAEAYPEVPAEIRRGLVIGAVAGAQQTAHLRYIILDNKKSPKQTSDGWQHTRRVHCLSGV